MHFYTTYVRKVDCRDCALTLQKLRYGRTGKQICFACVCSSTTGEHEACAHIVDRLRGWFFKRITEQGEKRRKSGMQQELYQILDELLQCESNSNLALSGALTWGDSGVLFVKNGIVTIISQSYGVVCHKEWKGYRGVLQVEEVRIESGVGIMCYTQEGNVQSDLWQSLSPGRIRSEEQLQSRFQEWMEHVAPFDAAVYLVSV